MKCLNRHVSSAAHLQILETHPFYHLFSSSRSTVALYTQKLDMCCTT